MRYDDIINLPHHESKTHKRMPMIDRAAQFAPFAALTGHDDAIRETARLTNGKIELAEDSKALINEKLMILNTQLAASPPVRITYFKKDGKKDGGEYLTITAVVKKMDSINACVKMSDGTEIPFDDILEIEF